LVEKSQKNLLCLLDRGSLMGDPDLCNLLIIIGFA
jgi:hypothetical protein